MEMTKDRNKLIAALPNFFDSKTFSDLTIQCGNFIFNVHKLVICAQSEFFHKACTMPMKENLESLIRLGQDDPYVLEAMLQFMYKSSYDNDNDTTPKRRPAIVFAVQVYAMADKYQVDELKAYTLAKFISLAQEEWDQDFFCEALRLIYNNEMFPQHDQAMHEAAFEQILRHPVQLIRSKSFMSMIDEVGGIASRLSKELCSDMLGYKCEECGKVALVGPCLDLSHEHQTYYRCGMKCTWSEYTQVQGDETRSNGKVHGEHRY